MSPEQTAHFRQLLEEARSELESGLSELEAEARPVAPDVSLGRLTRQEALLAQSIAKEGIAQRKMRQKRIASALERVRNGSYGDCLECGEEIASGRLEIQPEAALCVRCTTLRAG